MRVEGRELVPWLELPVLPDRALGQAVPLATLLRSSAWMAGHVPRGLGGSSWSCPSSQGFLGGTRQRGCEAQCPWSPQGGVLVTQRCPGVREDLAESGA